ncbi:hypothetical protein [Dyella silvae]|uniref:hypothetical protein n=1 Tax=Dyella silvae TaxID=2994424 RepID=UPI0022642A28|nr:hypothetical protein [Dyella silvae]
MNTHDHHDDEPLPGEDELKALYRSLPRKEPKPALDEAVRQAAAGAVRPSRTKRMPRWPVAAASAAVLVLVAGVSWRWYEQPSSVPQIPAQAEMKEGAPAPQPAATSPVAAAEQAAPPAAAAAPSAAQNAPQMQASARPVAKARVMTPALATREATPPVAAPAPMTITSQIAEPAPAPRAAMPAPAPPSAPAPEVASESRADYSSHAVMAMKAAAASMRAAPVIDPTAPNPTDTPVQELDKIRQLFAQQRRDEALKRLAAFQQMHPDQPLPDDLRAQLPDHE